MPAHVLYGNSFLVDHALDELKGEVGPIDVLEANSSRLAAPQSDMGQLRSVCGAVPFLASYRLVVLEGLLSLSEARDARRRPASRPGRSGRGRGGQSAWEELPRYVADELPATTMLVIVDGAINNRNPLLGKLRPVGRVQEYPTPAGEALSRWVRNRAAEKGCNISPGAILLVSQLVGGDLWTMDSELEKLSLFAGERAIEEADVRALTPQARETNVFAAVDALLSGRTAQALQLVHRLRDEGAEFTYIVTMVARQVRMAIMARSLAGQGLGEGAVGARLGLSHQFAVKRTLEQARRHRPEALEWLHRRLLEADLAVKQGRMEPDLALDLLVGEASGALGIKAARRR